MVKIQDNSHQQQLVFRKQYLLFDYQFYYKYHSFIHLILHILPNILFFNFSHSFSFFICNRLDMNRGWFPDHSNRLDFCLQIGDLGSFSKTSTIPCDLNNNILK